MSTSELRRAGVLARVAAETLTLKSAAALMDVSYRQAKRLYGRYRAAGAKGLKHRSAGRASNRAAPLRRRQRVLALIRAKYGGGVDERFGPTLAAEHLASEDGVTVDHETLRRWMLAAGLWKNVYVRRPNEDERATGAEPLTQFGRMCAALGIKIIPASSPQAKGRIERNHGTQQDRLVKKLRRKGIRDIAAANVFLDAGYWDDHNRRFGQAPASEEDFHVAVPRGQQLDKIFRLQETRTVSNDWVVRYDNRLLQLERQSGRPPARSTVVVYAASDGQLEIRYRDRVMRWTDVPALPRNAETRAESHTTPVRRDVRPIRPRIPCADHPWRRKVEQYRLDQQLRADRKAYAAVNP